MLASCLDGATTSSYEPIASSDLGQHGSLLSTIATVTGIMNAVSKPFIAKIADISSRQTAYLVVLVFYVVGYAVMAGASTPAAYAAGQCVATIGDGGMSFVTGIIVADLSPLEWRGFIGSLGSAPWLWFAFIGPNISGPLIDRGQWRWGYGMFCIITLVMLLPAIFILFAADRRAKAIGDVNIAESLYARRYKKDHDGEEVPESYFALIRRLAVEIDAFGLFLLGASFVLILTPFSIASQQPRGWHEPFIIAMMTLGAVLLIVFAIWDIKFAASPVMTKRIFFNRTFLLAMAIDFCYFAGGYLISVYHSSYVYVLKPWSNTKWGYFNNVMTMGLCGGGLIVGLLMRATHRYKFIQLSGLCIRAIGVGIVNYAMGDKASDVALIFARMLTGLGGACSVVGTRVASEASVPHHDLASVIALLSLWTNLGGSIGSAIAGAVWTNNMPKYLVQEGLPHDLASTLYRRLAAVHSKYELNDPIRQAVIRAATRTLKPLFLSGLLVAILSIGFGLFMPNYRLGKTHNKIETTDVAGRKILDSVDEKQEEVHGNETTWQRIRRELF
ncbi:MFS general substrate transporter [Auricularia subglabra TFB-10046 SS5]|nr:MFS general substrate transporter [Auricularia subglabra TFB-10046 SS5]